MYLTGKINGLVTNRKNRNIRELNRGICEFRGCYQPLVTVTKDEKSHLLAETHSILNRWKNNFHQLFHVHGTNDVRQTEKLKVYKSQGSNHITQDMIPTKGWTVCSEIYKLLNSTWNKEELPQLWKESIMHPFT
jgi:hypothetical protein